MALSKMGSSVFHGGFSTFASISVISSATNYIFVVFYRLWFGIILFGMANGFFFLPVVLSFIGPIETVEEHDDDYQPTLSSQASLESLSPIEKAPSPNNKALSKLSKSKVASEKGKEVICKDI